MAGPDRIKRRLLQELVEENVELIRGDLPGASRRHRRGRRTSTWRSVAAAALFLTLGTLALLGLARVPATTPATVAEAPAVETPAEPRATPVPETARAATGEARYTPPRPLDGRALPLGVHRIVLDPGHGGAHPGAEGPLGLIEKEVTLDLARRLASLLTDAGFEVLLTREGDEAVSLAERALLANEAGADLFVSIHLNWIVNRKVRGVETYYLGTTDDPYLTELAAAENRGSGLSMSELRPLLDDIYLDVRNDQSRALAASVQRALYRSLSRVNPELSDRGVKTAPFIVLAKTEMPAILAEVSCLSNRREAELLTKPLYRQYIAEALFEGLAGYADAPGGALSMEGS